MPEIKPDEIYTTEEAQTLADKHQLKYFEVSTHDLESITNVFRSLTRYIIAIKE